MKSLPSFPIFTSIVFFSFLQISCKKSTPEDQNQNSGTSTPCTNTDSFYVRLSSNIVVKNGYDVVEISVFDSTGNNITTSCNIVANASSNLNAQFVPSTETGTLTITALGKNCYAPSTSAQLVILPSPFRKKILAEDCTGAWCGFCPRLADKLERYHNSNSDCILTAVHGGGGTDPMKFQYYTSYNNSFGVSGYPTVIINRKKYNGSYDWSEETSVLDNALNEPAPLGISISSTLAGNNVEGTVKVKFGFTPTSTKPMPLKLAVNYVENGIVYRQDNYYSAQYGYTPYLYGGVHPIANFQHNNVLRRTATNLFGDLIPANSVLNNGIYEYNFSIPINGSTSGGTYTSIPSNSAIVAFVLDGNSGSPRGVFNVQHAAVGETVNPDFNE